MSASPRPVFIVVDDDPDSLPLLSSRCESAGFEAFAFEDVRSALKAIAKYLDEGRLVGIVSDLKMPGTDGQEYGGWEVIQGAYALSPRLALAAYTAHFADHIIKLFKSGAAVTTFRIFDKPGQLEELSLWLKTQYDRWQSRLSLILRDASTAEIYNELAPVYSRSELPILILGDTGTGKESLARHIHDESGRKGPFVPVNCGGLEPSVAFAELYGYQQGAFTDASRNEIGLVLQASGYAVPDSSRSREEFIPWLRRGNADLTDRAVGDLVLWSSDTARQNAGTLFLDEVGSLPPKVMAGLLRLLSSHDVVPLGYHGRGFRTYCRIIAATNETRVLDAISKGTAQTEVHPESLFRADLYYRLNGAVLHLSALKDRDPREIKSFFDSPFSWLDIGVTQMLVEDAAIELVQNLFHSRHDPVAKQYQNGNFRSLRNLLHRAALIARTDRAGGPAVITVQHMRLAIEHGTLTMLEQLVTSEQFDQGEYIRRRFRDCALKRDVKLPPRFTRQDLRDATNRNVELIAATLLDVLVSHREPPDPAKTYYEQKEIETAIYRGYQGGAPSPSSFLNKLITADHLKKAAIQYFGVPQQLVSDANTIRDVVSKVREHHASAAPPDVGGG